MTTLFDALVQLLPTALRPFAKAVLPAIGTALAVGVQYLATGALDRATLATAITGGTAALVTFLTSNQANLLHEDIDVPEGAMVSGAVLGEVPVTNGSVPSTTVRV